MPSNNIGYSYKDNDFGGLEGYGIPRPYQLLEQTETKKEGKVWKTTFKIYTGFPAGTQFVVQEYRFKDPRIRLYPVDEIYGTEIEIWVQCDRIIEPGEITAIVTPYNDGRF